MILKIIVFFLAFCFGFGLAIGIASDDKKEQRKWQDNFNKVFLLNENEGGKE